MTEQWAALVHKSLLCTILYALSPPSSDLVNDMLKMEKPQHEGVWIHAAPLGAERPAPDREVGLHLGEKLPLRFGAYLLQKQTLPYLIQILPQKGMSQTPVALR